MDYIRKRNGATKVISLLIAVVMTITAVIPIAAVYAADDEIVASGTIGTTVSWTIDGEGNLVFSPTTGDEGTLPRTILAYSSGNPLYAYRDLVKTISFKGTIKANADLNGTFARFPNLVSADLTGFDMSASTKTDYLFYQCPSLQTVNFGGWDASGVTNLSYMFYGCTSLTDVDTSGWNTESVTNMRSMFFNCGLLTNLDVSGWDTGNVTNFRDMFYGCSLLKDLDVSDWKTSAVTSMYRLFYGCESLVELDLSSWDLSNTTETSGMFRLCYDLKTLKLPVDTDGSKLTNVMFMFSQCESLESIDISGIKNITLSGPSACTSMFAQCMKLKELDISTLDITECTYFRDFFQDTLQLQKIVLGDGFKFKQGSAATQLSTGLPRGTWLYSEDGITYTSIELVELLEQTSMPGTYTKVASNSFQAQFPVDYRIGTISDFVFESKDDNGLFKCDDDGTVSMFVDGSLAVDGIYTAPGSFTMTFPDCVEDTYGNKYNLQVKYEDVVLHNAASIKESNGTIYTEYDHELFFISENGNLGITSRDLTSIPYSTPTSTTSEYKITLTITDKDGKPVDGSFIYSIYDLDVPDTLDYGIEGCLNAAATGSPTLAYGYFSEGIYLQDGFDTSTVTTSDPTYVWIIGDVSKEGCPSGYRITGTQGDGASELTDILAKADASGSTFVWTGEGCDTLLLYQYQPKAVYFNKYDQDGVRIDGAEIALYRVNTVDDGQKAPIVVNELIASWVSDSTKEHDYSTFLTPGNYVLSEIETPENYETADDIVFVIDNDFDVCDDLGNKMNNNNVIIITDTRKLGDLQIAKIINSDNFDKEFTVNVTITDGDKPLTGEYFMVYPVSSTENSGRPGKMLQFVDGHATFTIRGNEARIITGLPAGSDYVVEEGQLSNGWSLVEISEGTGRIVEGTYQAVFITNKYTAEPVSVQFSGTKTLSGRELKDGEFSFTLTGSDGTNETVTNNGNGSIIFSEITFDEAGTYTYEVSENAENKAGVTADDTIYRITVTVTDNDEGQLVAEISGDTTTGKDLDFSNRYDAESTSVQFSGTKTLNGRELKDGEFSFTLTGSDGTNETVTNDGDGNVVFSAIIFDKTGTYTYEIKEDSVNVSGVAGDDTVYKITVTVTDNGEGQLVAEISGDTTTGKDINFVNDYKAAPAEVRFSGTVILNGRDLRDGEFSLTLTGSDGTDETVTHDSDGQYAFSEISFDEAGVYTFEVRENPVNIPGVTGDDTVYKVTVTVTDDGNGQLVASISGNTATGQDLDFVNNYKAAPVYVQFSGTKTFNGGVLLNGDFSFILTGSDGTNETVTNDGDGNIVFSVITFDEIGEYVYEVKEIETDRAGVSTDNTVYKITVTVTDDGNGQLVAKLDGNATPGENFNFVNTYKAAPVEVRFGGTVILNGRDLKDGEFSFTLTGSGDKNETVVNDSEGKHAFSPIVFDTIGTYIYEVRENAVEAPGLTMDSTVYTITVSIVDDGSGQLKAIITGADIENLDFVNVYKANGTGITMGGEVALEGYPKEIELPVFTCTLSSNGEIIDQKTTLGSDSYHFDEIVYEEAGTYRYTVREVTGTADGVTYDTRTYDMIVVVTDDGNGQLNAFVTGAKPEALNFVNTYKAGTPSGEDSPRTGDLDLIIWSLIAVLSFAGVIVSIPMIKSKKRKA